jgi:hypothetical protein
MEVLDAIRGGPSLSGGAMRFVESSSLAIAYH